MKSINRLLLITIMLTGLMLSSVSTTSGHGGISTNEDPVTDDMCSTPTTKVVAIAWANEDTGDLHLDISRNSFDKGECVMFTLVNADIEDDGSFADHDFDFKGDDLTFHQEFNRNSTNKVVMVQFPNKDIALTLFCGVPNHQVSGMEQTIYVGDSKPAVSTSDDSPIMSLFIGIFAIVSLAIVLKKQRKY